MKIRCQKKWTVLIYANGNNELEPEMVQSLLDSEKVGSSENINVLMQIGRVKRELVKIIRPGDILPVEGENWTGVRRYYVRKAGNVNVCQKIESELLEDLGKLNMADPKVLYEFIKWGMESYPAEKYMLFIGGHGFEYVGALTDYSHNLPYIMTISQMCKAINLSPQRIDILVLDMCFMNLVEVLYQLTKEKNYTVRKVITYIEEGPMQGIALDKVLTTLNTNLKESDLNTLIANLIENLKLDLVALEPNRKKLERIKKAANNLAINLFKNAMKQTITIKDILRCDDITCPWYEDVKSINRLLMDLVIYYKRINNQDGFLINIAHKRTNSILAQYYYQLDFTKNNEWAVLLKNITFENKITINEGSLLKPSILPVQAVVGLISVMNHGASEQELGNVFESLVQYKGWHEANIKFKK